MAANVNAIGLSQVLLLFARRAGFKLRAARGGFCTA
jgi:hypothetical protein